MKNLRHWTIGVAAAAVVAVIAVTAIHHSGETTSTHRAKAELLTPQLSDAAIVDALREAKIDVSRLSVRSTGGIVVLRGNADRFTSERAVTVVKTLGFARVANLISVKAPFDDEGIRRSAERQLASARGLDGCTLRVSCERGVLRVEGTAQNELQVDLARSVLRKVEGANEVRVELQPQPLS
jgi:osmotically-inducible protein OsmY